MTVRAKAVKVVSRGADAGDDVGGRLSLAWIAPIVTLGVAPLVRRATHADGTIADYYFFSQDLSVLAAATLVVLLSGVPNVRLRTRPAQALGGFIARRALSIVLAAAGMVAIAAFAGWYFVYHQYPLSRDEYWEQADSLVLRHGRLAATIAPAWRPYAPALSPDFRLPIAGHAAWISTYLPFHGALRALFGALGSMPAEGPLCAGLSVLFTFSLARRFWPDRPDAAVVAAVLLATSTQLVVTAMSPYSMSAQLALNLGWLWLFLGKGWPSQIAAAATAFVACGLHQLIFQPLFAAPFVLQLWLERRWPRAVFHTVAYAAIGLFWISYRQLLLAHLGLALTPAAGGDPGAKGFLTHTVDLVAAFKLGDIGLMAENLLRFAAWQNPLAVALGLIGAGTALTRLDRQTAPLAAGLAIAPLAMLLVLAFQGHGWGYRYLHGFLGSLCLLAAFAWVTLTLRAKENAQLIWAAFALSTAFALFVALPWRAQQVSDFIAPYARADAAIRAAPADIVIVDSTGLWYSDDLVRNDPFLANAPKVMDIDFLFESDIRSLCARYRIATFDRSQALPLGVRPANDQSTAPALLEKRRALRALMKALSCGQAVRAVAPAGAGIAWSSDTNGRRSEHTGALHAERS